MQANQREQMNEITLDEALDTVMQLPLEQQEMLLEIIHSRHIENRRREMAQDAQASLAAFRAGELRPQSATDIITELRLSLTDEEE
jgi:hypothetical protein